MINFRHSIWWHSSGSRPHSVAHHGISYKIPLLKKKFFVKNKIFFFFYISQTKLQALPHQESLWTRFWPPQWILPPGVSRFQAWNSPRRFESQKPPSFLQLCVWFQFSRRGSLFPHLALHTWKIWFFLEISKKNV